MEETDRFSIHRLQIHHKNWLLDDDSLKTMHPLAELGRIGCQDNQLEYHQWASSASRSESLEK